jgi:plasmid stability protein
VKQLIIRVSPALHQRIAARAAREGKSVNAWVRDLLDVTVDADVAGEDRQARANAKAAALGMLVTYDDIPEYDEETLRQGEQELRELAPEALRILNEDRSTGL